jgi:hypothetical protein
LKELLPYLVGVFVLIVVIALLVYWFYQKKKSKNPVVHVLTKREAHTLALRKLKELDAAKKWQKGDIKNYYLSLSETIREYIENRFLVLAKESTTPEIINDVTNIEEINPGQVKHLKELLELSDLAKFAKMQPLPDENIKAMKLAFDFVTHTKPTKEIIDDKKILKENGDL